MYLKSLTLKGFKSFANKSVMQFEPGLTVVVGPNGSGKSNISDAILWVLGEQSAKQLRGQAMEDVIFAGSSVRAAVGVAEVTLVLDNSDNTLPVDYTEVAITRRMYRSGESEYLINGTAARLRDIQDILHDSGLGKDAHSIIGQGKLEQVLTSKPEERRVLIEEAAGISKHRRRKERSVKKLAQMDASLMRARDMERALLRQLRPLERQVDRAEQFRTYDGQIRSLQTALAVDDLRQLKAEFDTLEATQADLETACEVSRLLEQQRKDEAAKLEALLEEKGLFAGDLTSQRQQFYSARDRVTTLTRLAQQKAHHARGRLQSLDVQEENSANQLEQDRAALEEVQVDVAGIRAQLGLFEERIATLKDEATRTQEERKELDRACGKTGHDVKELRLQADRCELELSRAQGLLKNAEVQKELFATRIDRLSEERGLHDAELQACEVQVSHTSEQAKRDHERYTSCEKRLSTCRAELERTQAALQEKSQQAEGLQAQLTALKTMARTLERQDKARKALASLPHLTRVVQATLARLVHVPQRFESLVEQICKEYLTDYLVSQQDASDVINEALNLTESGCVRLFFEREYKQESYPEIPGAIHLLTQLEVEPQARSAFAMLLGSVYVVTHADDALRLARQYPTYTFAAEDGRLKATHSYVEIICHAHHDNESTDEGYLGLQRKIKEITQQLLQAEAEINEVLLPAHECAARDERTAQDAHDEAKNVRAESEHQHKLAIKELERLRGAQARLDAEFQQVQARARELMEQEEESQQRLADLTAALETRRLEQQQAEDRLAHMQAARDKVRTDEQLQQERLNAAQLEEAAVRERAKYLETRAESLRANLDRLTRLQQSTRAELELQRLADGRLEPLITTLLNLEQAAEFWMMRINEQVALEQEGSHTLKQRVKEARDRQDEAAAHTQSLLAQIAELKVDQGKVEVQVEQVIAAINNTGAILEEALMLDPLEDRQACEAELKQLQANIERLGPINHVAMHQYEELKAQHAYIAQQTADLDYARKAIQKIIAAIDRKMKEQFLTTFAQVDANFREIFATLFDGGRAHLELTDPDQPHETGVEVVAQPRGKRLSKMTLLSGGEKSLTAISLLFALYKTRTVPFYVLDEIEAALDDANLERLLRALDEFKSKTQLIVVSHQRKTMERADVLYGVSMHADGISQVVSQKLTSSSTPAPSS